MPAPPRLCQRRARGRFVLFTNPDDVWTEGLGALLGRRQLRPDVFYVTHRGSVADHIPVMKHVSAASMLAFAQEYGRQTFTAPHMTYSVGHQWNTSACDPGQDDELPMGFSRAAHGFFFIDAVGDFFLISRQAVFRMRGHPEIPHTGLHVDGLLPYVAAAHGFRQLVMKPKCSIYHQEHARSAGSHVETFRYAHYVAVSADLLAAGSSANHRPPDASFYERLEYHRWNSEDWGLASEPMAEVVLKPACRGAPFAASAEAEAASRGSIDASQLSDGEGGVAGNSPAPLQVAMARLGRLCS